MQITNLALPQILNVLFSILCIIYLQLRGQILNILIPQIIILAIGIAFNVASMRKAALNEQSIDHSPIIYTILLILQFASLLYLSDENQSENLLSLLFGCMLSLQKLTSNSKIEKKQFLNKKIILQSLLLFIIIIIIALIKNISNHLEYLILALVLLIIVCSYELILSNYKYQAQQNDQQTKIMISKQQTAPNVSQMLQQNAQSIIDKFNDTQLFQISYRNNEIIVEKTNQILMQFLKEKNLTFEEYTKKIQLFQISYESEHILTNSMIKMRNETLSSFLKDQQQDEKQSAVLQRRKSQNNMNDEQQKFISPSNELRSRQSVQKNEGFFSKSNTINLNNSSFYIDPGFLSNSAMKQFDGFLGKPQENFNLPTNKKQPLYGILQNDKSIYKKIFVTYLNQGLIIEIEDDTIENLKIQVNNIQNGYKQEVTHKQILKLSDQIYQLTQKFNKLLSNRKDTLLRQAQSQLYVLDVSMYNFIYFLSDKQPNFQQINIMEFLKSIGAKFQQDKTVKDKTINIIIQGDQNLNKTISTEITFLRQIIANLLVNSIQAYQKPDLQNTIQIIVSQANNDDLKIQISDRANGFSQPLDLKRVREGKLGIYIVQKLLPQLSKNSGLVLSIVEDGNRQVGSSISFVLSRQVNQINSSIQNSSNNLLQQETFKLAQLTQPQQLKQQQGFI